MHPLDTRLARVVAAPALIIAAAGCCAAAAPAAKPQPTNLSAVALADTTSGGGDTVDVASDMHLVRKATIEWTTGVTGRIPAWSTDTRVAAFVLVNKDDARTTGNLWATGRKAAGTRSSIRLRSRGSAYVAVTFRAGSRPRLEITTLPAGTRSIEITTVAGARNVLRLTAACHRRLQHEATRINVTLGDTSHVRTVSQRHAISCGGGIPREP
jgi:hypothetical protein